MYEHLASSFELRGIRFRNRIFSSGHQTLLARDGGVSEALIAYHEARARGGAALIVTEAIAVHESAYFNEFVPAGYRDGIVPGLKRLAEAVHGHDCRLIGQLFHPGAEVAAILPDGTRPVAWAPSAHHQERYLVTARAMPGSLIEEIIAGFGEAATRMIAAGLDGVEVLASHGYLPVQFCNPRVNHRTDEWGGSFANRMRFLEAVHDRIRENVGEAAVVGLRISADDRMADGFTEPEVMEVLGALDAADRFDYFNVTLGSSATVEGAVHIAPPMSIGTAYVAPYAERVRRQFSRAVLATGRFNQPQEAERALAAGHLDMVGMTRAQICDPELAGKALGGRGDDIRACIACNQACIGHYALGAPISCIQYPESGRELRYGTPTPAAAPRRVTVVGGGPAGLKAAAVAAARGHSVTLYEKASRLGGQACLAAMLPERTEFGGIVENLAREARAAGVDIHTRTPIDADTIRDSDADVVVVATGALPHHPTLDVTDSAHVVDAWSVIRGEVRCGNRVVVADWSGDWIGIGVALKLVKSGHHVRIATVANCAGLNVQYYTRDPLIAELDRLGVTFVHYARLYGADEDTAYFVHAGGGHAIEIPDVDTVVACYGHRSVDDLALALEGWHGEVHCIGDALAPRTAEEAVLEGLKVGTRI